MIARTGVTKFDGGPLVEVALVGRVRARRSDEEREHELSKERGRRCSVPVVGCGVAVEQPVELVYWPAKMFDEGASCPLCVRRTEANSRREELRRNGNANDRKIGTGARPQKHVR